MGITIIVNKLTVSHKGSSGTSIAFPDVCKTPTPAGPVPIPYPNIAKSADTMKGSKTVKMDKSPIMLKGANMMMSTGDEAGTAMGIVSNKIKGKAEFVNYSFDVKVDGKNVCRLTDPTQQNMGSGNSIAPAHVQAPLFAMTTQLIACDKVRKKEEPKNKKKDQQTGWDESGVFAPHRSAFEKAATDHNVIIFLRRTSKYCVDNGRYRWIPNKHMPKPHSIINGNTLKEKNENLFKKWLNEYWNTEPKWRSVRYLKFKSVLPPIPTIKNYTWFYGIAIDNDTGEPYKGIGKYQGKWVTADYDIMDVVTHNDPDCVRLTNKQFNRLMHDLNKTMKWDGIQHGPQAYWISKPEDWKKGADKFNIPMKLTNYLATVGEGKKPNMPKVTVAQNPIRQLDILDQKLNVIAPKGHVIKTDDEDTANALICCGCHRPKAWIYHDKNTGFRSEG